MKEKRVRMPISKSIQISKVFRQNILFIGLFSALFTVFYYPIFLFRRRKALREVNAFPRYWFQSIFPFVALGIGFITQCVVYLGVSARVLLPVKEQVELGQISMDQLATKILQDYGGVLNMTSRIITVGILLCFVIATVDMLVVVSERLQGMRVRFPKVIHHTPYVFTISAFLYIIVEALQMSGYRDMSVLLMIVQVVFIVSLMLVHLYLMNVYVLFQTIQMKKEL